MADSQAADTFNVRTPRSHSSNSPTSSTSKSRKQSSEDSVDNTTSEKNHPNRPTLFNDSVHGPIELPYLCVKIIDTQMFQRLRQIKQLGFTYHVYPGASHNRFEHCLGVCYLAGKTVDYLNKNRSKTDREADPNTEITEKEKLCLQIAGLLHDIGHGPYSHTWQKFMQREENRKPGDNSLWKHEQISVKLVDEILESGEIKDIFAETFKDTDKYKNMIKDMITGDTERAGERKFLYEIISNDDTGIDVDKWDYLLRDSKYLNLNITFDSPRLMMCQRVLKLVLEESNEYHIFYRDKAIPEIYQMYLMRAELHRKAYQHPVVMIIEEMWIDALCELNKTDYNFQGMLLNEAHEDPYVYTLLTDELFDFIYREEKEKPPRKLLERIKARKLYKIHEQILIKEDEYEGIEKMFQEEREKYFQEKNEKLDLYIAKIQLDMKNLKYLSNNVNVYNKEGSPMKIDWTFVLTFFSNIQDAPWKRTELLFFSKEQEYDMEGIDSVLDMVCGGKIRKMKPGNEPGH